MTPKINLLLACLTLLMCCRPSESNKPPEPVVKPTAYLASPKIDIHAHFQYSRDYLVPLFKEWNLQALLVDVSKQDSTITTRSWDRYLQHQQQYPDLFSLCSSFIGVGIDDPGYADQVIAQLTEEIDAGAKMVKVWKNFGMVTQDQEGNFIQIDDPRLQPIWDFLQMQNVPVMAHIGEPQQAWLPLDDPQNPHYGYYTNHPEYHAYKLPEIPHYDSIINARDRWLDRNPQLTVLCAHLGSMSHDVDMVAQRLDSFPNMLVEMGARFGDLAGQDSDKVRRFFMEYQDRILFGSDYGNGRPQDELSPEELDAERDDLVERYERLWRYLATSDSLVIRNQQTKGLALEPQVLNKVWFQNSKSLLGL